MSKQYHDSATGGHIPFRQARHSHLIGTPTFASINCHLGAELSWCDDLESLAYVLIYFLCGLLPWLQVDKRAKKNFKSSILNIKQTTLVEASCSGLPVEMSTILIYTHMLSFSETPDYDYIWSLLTSLQNSSLSPTNIASFIRDELHLSDPHTTTHNDPKYLCNEVAQFYDSPLKKHGMNSPPLHWHPLICSVIFIQLHLCWYLHKLLRHCDHCHPSLYAVSGHCWWWGTIQPWHTTTDVLFVLHSCLLYVHGRDDGGVIVWYYSYMLCYYNAIKP